MLPAKPIQRLAWIDWMRGLACLLMFQTHCYDAWLSPEVRQTSFLRWSQLGGTFPAPFFLFLAGISFALVTDKMRRKGASPGEVARTTLRRGAEIYALGIAFRVQEFLLGWPGAPWTDLFRVDVLNIIGLSMMLMALVNFLAAKISTSTRLAATNFSLAAATAVLIAMATPPLWTTARPRWLPWQLESYINGVHTYPEPQPWLFPIFPWTAFAFAGLAIGFFLFSEWARKREGIAIFMIGGAGFVFWEVARFFDHHRISLYAVYDYWHTSPNFFLARLSVLMVIVLTAYAWCRWGLATRGFSPLIQLGQTSLLVYWVHIQFVYGRFSILEKRAQSIEWATIGLIIIFLAMLLLSLARTRFAGKGRELWLRFRGKQNQSPA